MQPTRIIIHELKKEQHKDLQPSDYSQALLDLKNPKVMTFSKGLYSAYGKKKSTTQYGVFQDLSLNNSVGETLAGMQTFLNDAAFLSFTKAIMKKLEAEAKEEQLASGGFIVFMEYTVGSDHFFMIAMVKKKTATTITQSLTVDDLEYIDLSKLHQAFRINLTSFFSFLVAPVDEQSQMTYLSFISPSSQLQAAGYFVKALNCKKGNSSAKSTKNTIIATKHFFDSDELKTKKDDVVKKLEAYLNMCQKSGSNASLSHIESLARQFFPATCSEKHDELSEEFTAFLNSEAYQVPPEFRVDKATIRKYFYISYSDEDVDLLIKKDMLSRDPHGAIVIKDGKLIFNRPSKSLLDKIEDTIKEMEQENDPTPLLSLNGKPTN
ncbi:nucleoid-associated protein [Marinomonas gallaica]|uniref:nucleoid-associated protein n=1 Tax=Marinomonas gallaica TaxID=1806667 RepID=UPI003CE53110